MKIEDFIIEKEMSKSGLPTLKINHYYIHSKYDPLKEALQFVEKNFKPASVHILIGYGEGYIYKELENSLGKDEKIIVLDPLNEVPAYIRNSRSTEPTEVEKFLKSNITITDTCNVYISPNYKNIIPEYCKNTLLTLNEIIQNNRVSENTMDFFGNTWHQNFLENTPNIVIDPTINELVKQYDCPIVVAASGPSITKQLPLLKLFRDKIIIIAAGTTINVLMKNEVIPDYVVSIDGTELNYNHFKDVDTTNLNLVYSLTQHPKIRPLFKQNSYVFHSHIEKDFAAFMNKVREEPLYLLSGGSSVATFAYSLALTLTTGKVALIGQDLAYTNNQTHASNNLNMKKIDHAFKEKKVTFETEGYDGDRVLTDHVFIHMKSVFETINENNALKVQSFNCTEGGIKIKNFNQKPFKEFLDEFALNTVTRMQSKKQNTAYDVTSLLQLLEENQHDYDALIMLFEESITLLNKNKLETNFSNNILKRLDKNDKKIEALMKELSLKASFDFVNLNVLKYFKRQLNETAKEEYQRVFNQSIYFYTTMKKITEEDLVVLKQTMKNIKEVHNNV